jgi:hypothetical protein
MILSRILNGKHVAKFYYHVFMWVNKIWCSKHENGTRYVCILCVVVSLLVKFVF